MKKIFLVGDVGLCGFEHASIPLEHAAPVLAEADVVFGNLECVLAAPPAFSTAPPCPEPVHPGAGAETRVGGRRRLGGWDPRFSFLDQDGLFAAPELGAALVEGGFTAVGCANNQTYGPEQIVASLRRLDELQIGHVGAGENRAAARRPAIADRNGVRVGFVQYTSVYWPSNHEAGLNYPGVAVIKGYTSYQPILEYPIGNRPGVPPIIRTWADADHLREMQADIRALRSTVDVVVSSHHWGFLEETFEYQEQIAHAAVDAGADVVIGHGPHQPLAVEVYRGRPIFYGLGNFAFKDRHWKSTKGAIDAGVSGKDAWTGILVEISWTGAQVEEVAFRPVRHNERLQTVVCAASEERQLMDRIVRLSEPYGTTFAIEGRRARIVF